VSRSQFNSDKAWNDIFKPKKNVKIVFKSAMSKTKKKTLKIVQSSKKVKRT